MEGISYKESCSYPRLIIGEPIIVNKNNERGTHNEVTLELCLSVVFVCMVAVPTLVDWFPDAPDLVSDLYFSTVFFLLGLAT